MLRWKLYIAERLGNSRCIQGTGIDSGLWLTFPGEVVKSLDSEVILGYMWIHYWLFPVFIYTRTAYDFIERCSGDSGGIVPVFTANSVHALPCACAAKMKKETSKALKHWDDSLQLQNNHFTSRTPLDQIDYVQQTLVLRLECVSFVLLGGYRPFLESFLFSSNLENNKMEIPD